MILSLIFEHIIIIFSNGEIYCLFKKNLNISPFLISRSTRKIFILKPEILNAKPGRRHNTKLWKFLAIWRPSKVRSADIEWNPQIAVVRNVAVQITLYYAIALSGNGVWIREYDLSDSRIRENGFWVEITSWKVSGETRKRRCAFGRFWKCVLFSECSEHACGYLDMKCIVFLHIFCEIRITFVFIYIFLFTDTWELHESWFCLTTPGLEQCCEILNWIEK